MISHAARLATDQDEDALLANLLEQMADELRGAGTIDIASWQARFPSLASEIERLAPTLERLAELSAGSGSGPAPDFGGEDLAGSQTLGDFRLVRQLGRGGMGVVYEAEQLSLNRRVALKILPTAGMLDPRNLQRFKNEAQAAAALDHPHIVDVYGIGCERGIHCYAMRLIEGCTLAEVIAELRVVAGLDVVAPTESIQKIAGDADEALLGCDPQSAAVSANMAPAADTRPRVGLSTITTRRSLRSTGFYNSVAELGIKVAEGLHHAHEQGIVHRDIKPSNLMLDGLGKVWITDFGLAHIEANQSLTVTGEILGTLRYMSPEQALGSSASADHRRDIYSLGATLYELLTLQPVFGGNDRATLIHRIGSCDPELPRQINPHIPADLETILLKMLDKDADCRYASARALAEDLQRFVDQKPITARRTSWVQRVGKWSLRNRSLVAAGGFALLLMAMAIGGVLGWQARDTATRRRQAEAVAEQALEAVSTQAVRGDWQQALGEVGRAEATLAGRKVQADLQQRVSDRRREIGMVIRLERCRLQAASVADGEFDFRAAGAAYAAAFADFGVPITDLSPGRSAEQLRQSPISLELADAVTNWSIVRQQTGDLSYPTWQHLLSIAQEVDADPWRSRLRSQLVARAKPADELFDLTSTAQREPLPRATLCLLIQVVSAQRLSNDRVEAFVRQAQRLHPADFWINFAAAKYFESTDPPRLEEVVRYYSVALAMRPDAGAINNNLGVALYRLGQPAEAAAEFRRAIEREPRFAMSYSNLGHTLREMGAHDEAVKVLRQAVALQENLAMGHRNLGIALLAQGATSDAETALQKAITLDPVARGFHYDWASALQRQGRVAEAIAAYRRELELQPNDALAHNNLGAALEAQGQLDEAIREYRRAVELQPAYDKARENLESSLKRLGNAAPDAAPGREP